MRPAHHDIVRSKLISAFLALAICLLMFATAPGQETLPEGVGKAPEGHVEIRGAMGGGYYVRQALKAEFDDVKAQAELLRSQIARGQVDEEEASARLRELQERLSANLAEIERSKVLVTAAEPVVETTTTEFELGPARSLFIVADRVQIVGTDGPNVRCVLEKTVLRIGDEEVAEDLQGLKVQHRHADASEWVGQSRQSMLDEAEGDLSPQRRRLMEQIAANYALYSPLQGREIDIIEVEGLSHQQGNRQITLRLQGSDGESQSSVWRRHARLTIYLPACETVALRGGLGELGIRDLNAALILRGDGDRDYEARREIVGLRGNLHAEGLPLHAIRNVIGDVRIVATADQENAGTSYSDQGIHGYVWPAPRCEIESVTGSLHARYCRADLDLSGILGAIDVVNEYGDTRLTAGKLAQVAHRIVSHSGAIRVDLDLAMAEEVPLLLLTQCGSITASGLRQNLQPTKIGIGDVDGSRRSFHCLAAEEPQRIDYIQRVPSILSGGEREAGLDLLSHAGVVYVTTMAE